MYLLPWKLKYTFEFIQNVLWLIIDDTTNEGILTKSKSD